MSITDELREWTRNHTVNCSDSRIALVAIANRIDAEHERAKAGCIHYDPERHYCSVHGDTEHGWVKFPPLDADGEPWHIGDRIANQYNHHLTVSEIAYESNGCWMLHAKPNWRFYADVASHYHEPTVDDVLREFADRVCNSGHQWGLDAADTIAEYAAKLRLAGDSE